MSDQIKQTMQHMHGLFSSLTNGLAHMGETVPAAAGISGLVRSMKAGLADLDKMIAAVQTHAPEVADLVNRVAALEAEKAQRDSATPEDADKKKK